MTELPKKIISLQNTPLETYLLLVAFAAMLDGIKGNLNIAALSSFRIALMYMEQFKPEELSSFMERITKTNEILQPEVEKMLGNTWME